MLRPRTGEDTVSHRDDAACHPMSNVATLSDCDRRGVGTAFGVNSSAYANHIKGDRERLQRVVNEIAGEELRRVEQQMQSACRSRYEDVQNLCEYVSHMGGKRLRPVLAILSSKIAGSQRDNGRKFHSEDLTRVAAAVELVHTASLVHDDVMDRAVTRRHRPTVGVHAGNPSAILLGDFLFTKAYELAARCTDSYPARRLARASMMLCEGELRQQATMGEWNTSIDTYLDILAEKTGALCAVACRLGVWSSLGKSAAVGRALTRYGMQLGLAFQLFDDWLDYWGTERAGKTLGTDLRQGKPTLPLLRLLECCSVDQRDRLLTMLEGDATHHGFNESVMQMLNESDASEFTLQMAVGCAESAVEELHGLPNSEARDCLEEIAKFSVARVA